jgi:all-trans-retinol 13,14-reductase
MISKPLRLSVFAFNPKIGAFETASKNRTQNGAVHLNLSLIYSMIQSYKQKYQVRNDYDTIVIGSGLGGLTTAALLAKEGQKVLVLERHYTAGGFTHIFKRKGYEWDVGIHYIGDVHKKHGVLRKLFDYITDGELEWADMGEVYDRVVIGDNIYDLVKGVQNFKDQMISYFPEEEAAIHAYVDLIFKAQKPSRSFYLEKALPTLASKVTGSFMRKEFLKYASRTTKEVLEELTDNQELIKVLTAQYGDYGLAPAESSFAMHSSVVKHYFGGGNFPVGGSGRLVETIDPVIEAGGGTILINAEVEELLVDNKRAVGVRMTDGTIFKAGKVVSGTGVIHTYKNLIPPRLREKDQLEKKLSKVSHSVSHACLYVGLKGSPEELQLPKANYWIYPEAGTHDEIVARYLEDQEQDFPVVYVSFPSAKDPDWSRRYPGKSTIDIITLLPYEAVAKWEETNWKKRGEEYDAYKEKISQRLLEALFKLEPHLRDKVAYYELSTPLTTKHFVNYEKGEIYGIDHSPQRFQQTFLRPHTPVKNFYLTGQDIVTAGIGGALFAGLLTASAMTKKNFLRKIFD